MSRATIDSSAAEGYPASPRREATQPSFTPSPCPEPVEWAWVIEWSSQWSMTGSPSWPAYSSAICIRCPVATGLPSSVKPAAPARASSSMSASSTPARPRETAPNGSTRTGPASAAWRAMNSTTVALSIVGVVLGMQHSVVKPPRAPAAVPVAMVSLSSPPGSRRWAWRSMKPGAATIPVPSITRVPSGTLPLADPRRAMMPSLISRSPTASDPSDGSMSRAFLMSSGALMGAPRCRSAAGRGAPSGARRRSSPAPRSARSRRGPARMRSRPPRSSGRGASAARPALRGSCAPR